MQCLRIRPILLQIKRQWLENNRQCVVCFEPSQSISGCHYGSMAAWQLNLAWLLCFTLLLLLCLCVFSRIHVAAMLAGCWSLSLLMLFHQQPLCTFHTDFCPSTCKRVGKFAPCDRCLLEGKMYTDPSHSATQTQFPEHRDYFYSRRSVQLSTFTTITMHFITLAHHLLVKDFVYVVLFKNSCLYICRITLID